MDVTFPLYPRTGQEVNPTELTKPDERNTSYDGVEVEDLQAGYYQAERALSSAVPDEVRDRISVTLLLGTYAWFRWEFHTVSLFWSLSCIEMALRVKYFEEHPDTVRVRPPAKKQGKNMTVPVSQLNTYLEQGWYFDGEAGSERNFHSLLQWAFDMALLPHQLPIPLQQLINAFNFYFEYEHLPRLAQQERWVGPNPTLEDIRNAWCNLGPEKQKSYQADSAAVLIRELPRLRNFLAHPSRSNKMSVGPRSAVEGYQLLIEIVSCLWPVPSGGQVPPVNSAHNSPHAP